MLSPRRLMLLGLALLIATVTAVFINQWLHRAVNRASAEAKRASVRPLARVLVATRLLPQGALLKADDVRWRPWPASVSGYLTADTASPEKLVGAVLRTPVAPGQPIPAEAVIHLGEGGGALAAVLPPDRRAVTIGVSAITGLAGFLMPGDHVDVLLSRRVAAGASHNSVSQTILQNIRVLGVDQRAADAERKIAAPETVTLEVTPKQAELLALVVDLGRLTLSLRSLGAPAEEPPVPPLEEGPNGARGARRHAPPMRVVVVRGVRADDGAAATASAQAGAGRQDRLAAVTAPEAIP